jgi:hypothetical protein
MYGLVEDYKDVNGDVKIPYAKVHHERPLGRWLSDQRRKARHGQLDPRCSLRLKSIGVDWNASWNTHYNMLKAFQKNHCHCMLPADQSRYKGLFRWVASQKDLYERGELPVKHKALLDHLDFDWGEESPLRKIKTPGVLSTAKKAKRGKEAPQSPSVTTRNTSMNSAYSQWPEEMAILPASYPLTKDKRQCEDAAEVHKATGITECLNAKAVRRATKEALKEAPQRSMKTKHLRRYLRDVFRLPHGSKKRDLDKLLDRALRSTSKMVKNGQVITLLKHNIA